MCLLNKMKSVLRVAAILLFFVVGLNYFPAHAAVTYGDITALELKNRIDDPKDKGYIILDIRTAAEYAVGHISTAINIPLKELGVRFYELDRAKDIIVYCSLGVQSKLACQILINAAFKDVYNLVGGLKEWNYGLVTSDWRVPI